MITPFRFLKKKENAGYYTLYSRRLRLDTSDLDNSIIGTGSDSKVFHGL